MEIQRGVEQVRIKRKTGEKKDQSKDSSSNNSNENQKKESDTLPSACPDDEVSDILAASPSRTSNSQDFDDAGIDDDLDPAKMEELDREVEDFARRLNSDWPERMQEILSLGPERRLVSMNVNGSLRRYSGLDRR